MLTDVCVYESRMPVNLSLVPYSEAVRESYLTLLPEQEREIGRGKLEWKLRDSPGGTGSVAIATLDGETIGMNAFMPSRFRLGGEDVRAYQSMDTIVTPAARGKGVFGSMINCFYEGTDASLIYGFPNLNSSPGFFGKLGWKHFGAVPMLVRPLRTGFFFRRIAKFLPDVPLPTLARASRDHEFVDRFDDRATALWRRFSVNIGCAVERDADYLNWRLADHPSEHYTLARRGDEALAAWTVVNKHDARIGYLLEALGTETRALAPLIAASLKDMRKAGAELAFAWCLPGSPNYRAHRRAGFFPLPVKVRPIVINFGARALNASPAAVEDPRSWYVSYLDSDTV